jgi:hypothetical protein
MLFPLASAFEELELQAATDALSSQGFATVDHVFWRSSFGAPLLGGPTYAGNASEYDAFKTAAEGWSGGLTPTGALPVFLEFQSLSNPSYAGGNGSDTDFATQRWTFTNSSRVVGAPSLGAGAAAQAVWAQEFLRTNHDPDGTQSPGGALVGASNDTGLLGILMVQALKDRIAAVTAGAAFNGSSLGAFDLDDANLTDDDPANGWQRVPDTLGVSLNATLVFQGFATNNNGSSLAGQGSLILGLAEVVRLSDPTGPWASVFDGTPFDSSLHSDASRLLAAVANNAHAYHWDAVAGTYTEPDKASVDTGDLALFARALAQAESATASNATLKGDLGALRAKATTALASMAGVGGRYAASYRVSGATVTPDAANVSLWAQAQAIEAWAASFATTGLKADFDAGLRASGGLEAALYRAGSYAAKNPEGSSTTYSAASVAALVGALRDLSLTGAEPLAVYRFVDAYDTLVDAPPLALSAPQAPPVVGASFAYNATNGTASASTGFNAYGALLAAYEFASTGARYYASVGGGVFVSEEASQTLHNATATQVGTAIDTLDQQLADLQGQIAALQAAFDAVNDTASDIEERYNLSLENETISQSRITDLIANVTALRAQLNASAGTAANATALYTNMSSVLNDTLLEVQNLTNRIATLENETSRLLGDLNLERENTTEAETRAGNLQGQLDETKSERNAAQGATALAAVAGIFGGFVLFFFVNRLVLAKPLGAAPKQKADSESDEDDDEDGD